jgi:hypothetical protein
MSTVDFIRERCEHFRIIRRQGCMQSLHWHFVWRGAAIVPETFERSMVHRGFVRIPTIEGLWHFTHGAGEVLVVRRNVRVELRLPYTVPCRDRPRAALTLARQVAAAMQQATLSPSFDPR